MAECTQNAVLLLKKALKTTPKRVRIFAMNEIKSKLAEIVAAGKPSHSRLAVFLSFVS